MPSEPSSLSWWAGEVVVGDPTEGRTGASGPPLAVAARLQQAAGEGEVLVGDSTAGVMDDAAAVQPREERILDNQGQPLIVWTALDTVAGPRPPRPRPDSPLLGRDAELARLRALLLRVDRDARARMVTVIGDADIGKSRLAAEPRSGPTGLDRSFPSMSRSFPGGQLVGFATERGRVPADCRHPPS